MSNTRQEIPVRSPHPFTVGRLIPPLFFFAAIMMGADFTAMSLGPLKKLQIPYNHVMEYAHLIIAGSCAVLWLATIRWRPNFGAIVAIALCFFLISRIPGYAEHRISRVPVRRWVDSSELEKLESRGGFKVSEQGTRDGTFVLIAPQHEQQARKELAELGLLIPGSTTAE